MSNSTFNDKLSVPREWCDDLLSELAHHKGLVHPCDARGTFRSSVSQRRVVMLEDVLGLTDVSYRVCHECETFALKANTDWGLYDVCDECIEDGVWGTVDE